MGNNKNGNKNTPTRRAGRVPNSQYRDLSSIISPIEQYQDRTADTDWRFILGRTLGIDSKKDEEELFIRFNNMLPGIIEEIKRIDDSLPSEWNTSAGGFINFIRDNTKFLSEEEYEQEVFNTMLAQLRTTIKANQNTTSLIEPYTKTRFGSALNKEEDRFKDRLREDQVKALEIANTSKKRLWNILNDVFSGISIDGDGRIDMSALDLNNINIDGVYVKEITEALGDYYKGIKSIRNIGQTGAYDLSFYQDFRLALSGREKGTFSKAECDEVAAAIQNNPDAAIGFLGLIQEGTVNINKTQSRAEKYLAEENFWANDNAGAVYSNEINDGELFVPVARMMQYGTFLTQAEYPWDYSESDGARLLEERKSDVQKHIVGLLLHEYAHKVSQSSSRKVIEDKYGFNFSDFKAAHNKIKKLPKDVSNYLLDDNFGGYAVANPGEFYSEFIHFWYTNPENRQRIKDNFRNAGVEDVLNLLLKSVGES